MEISDLVRALWMAALPLFALSFGLVWWALRRGSAAGATVQELQQSLEDFGKRHKDEADPERADPVLGRWLSFGGGFYGLVALYTWLLIESDDVADFLGGLGDIVLRFDLGTLISLLVTLFIESIMNFVAAIAWPAYWLGEARSPWLWVLLAYTGYWLGIRAAQYVNGRQEAGKSPAADADGPDAGRDDDEVG